MKLIILDRDGVINFESSEYIKSPQEWRAIPGSLEAIAQLNQAGYTVVVATNQSGVGRGYYDVDTLDRIHEKLHKELGKVGGKIDHIFYCPHTPDDDCECRKPKPGLLHQIEKHYKTSVKGVVFIGDTQRDMDAAIAAGATPIHVEADKGIVNVVQELIRNQSSC